MLGILTLETAFPCLPGDLGSPATFEFPVLHRVVTAASVDDIVHRRRDTLLPAFVDAGKRLADAGCVGIATTCGFLVRWQRELTEALPVPVLTSALLQVPMIERTLPKGQRVGVVTDSAADLGADALAAAGVHPYTPIEGLDPDGYFAETIRFGRAHVDPERLADDTVAAARRLVGAHRDLGAIVLECASMPPYRDPVQEAVGLPVFDAAQLTLWFHAALMPARYARRDLW